MKYQDFCKLSYFRKSNINFKTPSIIPIATPNATAPISIDFLKAPFVKFWTVIPSAFNAGSASVDPNPKTQANNANANNELISDNNHTKHNDKTNTSKKMKGGGGDRSTFSFLKKERKRLSPNLNKQKKEELNYKNKQKKEARMLKRIHI